MLLRDGRLEDAETIAGFQMVMAKETEDLDLEPGTVRAGIRAVFADPTKGAYLVAEHEGEVVGSLLVIPEWSDWRNGTVLWIHSLYVKPAFRRQGVFRMMFDHLRGRVESSEALMGLRLYVAVGNEVAQQTYRSMGMADDEHRLFEWLK